MVIRLLMRQKSEFGGDLCNIAPLVSWGSRLDGGGGFMVEEK
jgi:hypothetical protein